MNDRGSDNHHYRIVGIRPWASEQTNVVPEAIRTFFENKEVTLSELHALAASFDATFESMVQGAARHQAAIHWHDHRYDLDLEPIEQEPTATQ